MTTLFDWAEGARLRDDGIEAAAGAQERDEPGWAERAYKAILHVAQRQPTVHVDDVLAIFPDPPHHHNAWAGPWRQAIRSRVITFSGEYRKTADPKKHAHEYRVYRSEVWES